MVLQCHDLVGAGHQVIWGVVIIERFLGADKGSKGLSAVEILVVEGGHLHVEVFPEDFWSYVALKQSGWLRHFLLLNLRHIYLWRLNLLAWAE